MTWRQGIIIALATGAILSGVVYVIVAVADFRLFWKYRRNLDKGKVRAAGRILAVGYLPVLLPVLLPFLPPFLTLVAEILGFLAGLVDQIIQDVSKSLYALGYVTALFVAWMLAGPAFAIWCYFLAARLLNRGGDQDHRNAASSGSSMPRASS